MTPAAILKRIRDARPRFLRSERGNVAIFFTFALFPIIGLLGLAVDYGRAVSARSTMQAAVDATALMISKEAAGLTSEQISTKAQAYFDALFVKPGFGATLTTTYTRNTGNGATVKVDASGTMQTDFMRVAGYPTLKIATSSITTWGSARLRVALVLDTTGSMDDAGKLAAMKTATQNLLNQLKTTATVNGDVYVSIIPFSRSVNVGASNYNASWIDWDEWEGEPAYMSTWLANSSNRATWEQTGPGDNCPVSNSKTGFVCTKSPDNGAGTTSTIPSSGAYSGYICPSVDNGNKDSTKAGFYYNGCYNSVAASRTIASGSGASCGSTVNCSCSGSGSNRKCSQNYFQHNWIKNARSTWTGCVADRGGLSAPGTSAGNDQTATTPTSGNKTTLYPARNDIYCGSAASGMSYDWTTMNSTVSGLIANGGTNQPIGLVMGWHSLVGIGPFTSPPKDANYQYTDVIILLSDGLNTWNRWYGNGSSTNTSVDYRMYDSSGNGTCKNIKAAGVTMYTIQVNTGGDPTSSVLQNCASSSDKFVMLTSGSQIIATFDNIGKQLAQLRIKK